MQPLKIMLHENIIMLHVDISEYGEGVLCVVKVS